MNSALNGVVGSIDANIVDALNGQPVGVTLFDNHGNAIAAPSSGCSVSVTNPNGITLGGGEIDGLGGNGNPTASAGAATAIAIGNGASTASGVADAVAIGTASKATTNGSVALGAYSVADRTNSAMELFSGTALRTSLGVISVGSAGAERQITNVAGGTADTDATSIRQLRAVGGALAASLGGNAGFGANGTYTAPSFFVGGANFNTVGGALNALDVSVTSNAGTINGLVAGTVGLVRQDQTTRNLSVGAGTDGSRINIAGSSGPRLLGGVAAGSASTDAVNIAQLDGKLSLLAAGFPIVGENSGGAPAPISSGLRSVAVGFGSVASAADTVSFGSLGSERRLVNVAPGVLAPSSTDAVNGAQLFATRGAIVAVTGTLGGGASFDPVMSTVIGPSYTVGGAIFTNVGGAIGALDASNATERADITRVLAGSAGMVQQDASTHALGLGAATGGTVLDVAGTSGARTVTGVAAGSSASDAVNFGQVNSMIANLKVDGSSEIDSENSGGRAAASATGLRSVAVGAGSVASAADTFSVGAAGAERRLVNVAAGSIAAGSTDGVNGGQLFTTRQGLSQSTAALGGGAQYDAATGLFSGPSYTIRGTNYADVGSSFGAVDLALGDNAASIAALQNGVAAGHLGLVQQNGSTGSITVGAGTGGSHIDFTGTTGARQLTGVAAGTNSTDAVNLGQLDSRLAGATGGSLALDSENSGRAAPASATGASSVAVGYGSVATEARTFSVGAAGAERQIVNVAAGRLAANSTDAVNGAQLYALDSAVSAATGGLAQNYQALTASLGAGAAYNASTQHYTLPTFIVAGATYTSVGAAFAAVDTQLTSLSISSHTGNSTNGPSVPFVGNAAAGTTQPIATGVNSIAGGYKAAATGKAGSAIGDNAQANGAYSTSLGARSMSNGLGSAAIGARSTALDDETTAIGDLSSAKYVGSTALGSHAQAIADPTTAVGYYATASGNNAVAVGASSTASGDSATAIGTEATADGSNSTALGRQADAAGANSVAVGQGTSTAGNGATAIGQGARANNDNSVAIGNGVRTTRANQIAIGNSQSTYTMTGIASATSAAAQSGPTSFVTTDAAGNLGAGTYGPQDIAALNNQVTQLGTALDQLSRFTYRARREARSGVASAMAMTSAPMPSAAGKTSWSANTATFRGEWAGGVAVAHRLDTLVPLAVTGGYSYGEAAGHGLRFGMAGEF